MNRILSLVLALALLLICALPASALTQNKITSDLTVSENVEFYYEVGNIIDTDGGSQDVEFYRVVAGGYTVSIPSGISLSKAGTTSTVEISNVNIGGGSVTVALSSPNYSDTWCLTSKKGTLAYSIKADGAELANNGILLSCPDGTQSASKQLSFSLPDDVPKTVSYTDILTITLSVIE